MKAETKIRALTLKEEQVSVQYDANMLNTIYHFLHDIGAGKDIPKKPEKKQEYIIRLHEVLSVNNPYYPPDIPFFIVYPIFFMAVVNNTVERKGNNFSALAGAFKAWIEKPGQTEKLYERWYITEPEKRPKQLQESPHTYSDSQEEADMNRLIRGKRVKDWPDEVILDQYQKITQIIFPGEKGKEIIESFDGGGYMHRIITEAQSRGLV